MKNNQKALYFIAGLIVTFALIFWGALQSGNLTEDKNGNLHMDYYNTEFQKSK